MAASPLPGLLSLKQMCFQDKNNTELQIPLRLPLWLYSANSLPWYGLCGNLQAAITDPSLGELPRNVDEIRELKEAKFSNGISMDAEAVCAWIPSVWLQDCHGCLFQSARASSALGRVQCHSHSEAEKKCGAALSIPK